MEYKTRCIVLKTTKFGDNKLIIDFLTREEGRQSLVCKISSSKNAKIRRQLFQPLSILDIEYERTPRQTMGQLKEARLAMVYSSIPFDGAKLSIAFFTAEFLLYTTRDVHAEPLLFDFVEQSLEWLDASDRGIANFHLMFMLRLSLFLGFFPNMESYSEGCFFDLREGFFCSHAPMHNDHLKPMEAKQMHILMRMSPSNMHLFRMSRAERNRIIDFILQFYQLHVPAFHAMKTLEVLRGL